jgi:hypothetical protein
LGLVEKRAERKAEDLAVNDASVAAFTSRMRAYKAGEEYHNPE